jgi:outer membrane protein assembly factor BamD (BamD/ComL family)
MVADRLPPTPYVPRALYGLAEIASARHDSAEADSLHQIILTRYTESEYADQVRKIKGLQTTGLRSTDSTQAKYLEAEHLLQAGMTAEAMKLFKGIASTRRASPFKPKAAYAVGYLYETAILNNDSAAEWYRHLSSDYPNSVYAAEVRPKVAVHDDPEAVKQFVKAKTIEPVGPTPDSLRHRPATPAKQSAIDRIKERQREEELNQLDEQDSKDEDDSKQDDEDLPDPDDDNNN